MKLIGLIILLLLSLPVAAAEWIRVRPVTDGDQYFYDRSKLYINGDEITYWKKVAFRTPATAKGMAAVSGLYRERIHCAEHTLKLISYLLYAADGNTIEYVASHEGEAAPIIPDTVGDMFEKTVCELVRMRQETVRREKAKEEAKKPESEKTKVVPIDAPGSETSPSEDHLPQPPHEEEVIKPATPPPPVVN
ncbi:MAG: hypothetical protein Q8N54_15775 [Sulfurimicrobium sp.]|jgi:hypothetical protein|nr:hypothetical protein [Sulfurimicrobium sp.]MDZ7656679.1 hypothetical protein [Sulfurimicrobium sp.]